MCLTPDSKSDKTQEEIDLVDAASGARRVLTWKRTGISSPKWSEDGTRLAFIAEDGASKPEANAAAASTSSSDAGQAKDDKLPQVFIMSMSGGDPIRVTEAHQGVAEFAWSPDGSQIAFITADEAGQREDLQQHDDAFQVTDNHFLTRAALTPWHLWLVSSAGGVARRLTQGSFSLQTDQQNTTPVPEWSRDGRSIAFTRFPGPYWGPSFHSVIASVDASGGEIRALVPAEGSNTASYSPTGGALAYLRPRDGDQNNGNAVYVMDHGAVRDVTQAQARNFDAYHWLPDGSGMLLEGADGTRSALWQLPLQGAARQVGAGRCGSQ